jgi:acyl-CoA synthetase (NDP forming)/GNAT superfamily N-acetyltransferase
MMKGAYEQGSGQVLEQCDVLLRDGGIAHLRALVPGDRAALHELVDATSERSAFLRFFTGGRGTAHAYVDRICAAGHPVHALVALVGGRLVAVAEFEPVGDGASAEVGVLLDDVVHGRGLGTLLLEHLAVWAAESGAAELVADVLAGNRAMLQVLADLGLETTRESVDGEIRVRVALHPTSALLARIERREHEAEVASLTRLLSPRSVAVIGAGRDPSGIGHQVLANLVDGGFPGPVYPVNPHATQVAGLRAYADLREISGPVDLAVVATPAAAVLGVARHCAEHGVRGLVVVSAGFAEAGGKADERTLLAICREAGMRLVGPNCLGIVNTTAHLNASFLPGSPPPGRMGLMSQSGAVAAALIDRAASLGVGVSSFVSVGNKADVSGNDLLEYWEDDPGTDVIAMYLESFGNPLRFGRITRRLGRRKPILVVKSGRSAAGDRAVRSHTAAAATPDVAVDALLSASGVIRLESVRDLLDTARLLTEQPLPAGPRVAIVGNSGGPEALTADACEQAGLRVPALSPATQDRLRSRAPASSALGNPVDLTAGATAEQIGAAVEAVLADPDIDSVLVVYTPPFGSGPVQTRQAIAVAAAGADKPVLACVMGHDGVTGGVPEYAFPEQAVHALRRVADYVRWRARPLAAADLTFAPDPAVAGTVRAELRERPEGGWLGQAAIARLLGHYGIDLATTVAAGSPEAAAEATARTGLPAVLKATGPDLVHKSDVGAVALDLRTPEQVADAYRRMAHDIGRAMTGAIVQPMARDGVEIIVGGVRHPAFGPLLMVGMGGVTAELLADRSFRVPPVALQDAADMIGELRCAPLLSGYRGRPKTDVAALERQIVAVGRFLDQVPEAAELDLNPVIVTPDGALTVDARVRLAPATPSPSPFRRRLR